MRIRRSCLLSSVVQNHQPYLHTRAALCPPAPDLTTGVSVHECAGRAAGRRGREAACDLHDTVLPARGSFAPRERTALGTPLAGFSAEWSVSRLTWAPFSSFTRSSVSLLGATSCYVADQLLLAHSGLCFLVSDPDKTAVFYFLFFWS